MSGNAKTRRTKKRKGLAAERKATIGAKREQERKVPHESERFKDGCTIEEILAYAKEKHLKH